MTILRLTSSARSRAREGARGLLPTEEAHCPLNPLALRRLHPRLRAHASVDVNAGVRLQHLGKRTDRLAHRAVPTDDCVAHRPTLDGVRPLLQAAGCRALVAPEALEAPWRLLPRLFPHADGAPTRDGPHRRRGPVQYDGSGSQSVAPSAGRPPRASQQT